MFLWRKILKLIFYDRGRQRDVTGWLNSSYNSAQLVSRTSDLVTRGERRLRRRAQSQQQIFPETADQNSPKFKFCVIASSHEFAIVASDFAVVRLRRERRAHFPPLGGLRLGQVR